MINCTSVLIIYNPNALKGKIDEIMPKVKQRLFLRFPVVEAMSSPDDNGAEILATKFASKYDIVVSCGGDGTLHRVINGVVKSGANPIIGVLPYGTCNDVAKTLGIPQDLDGAINCILRLNTTNYDVLFDGKEYVSYSLATGYLTKSIYLATNKSKRRLGRFAYFLSALKSMFTFKSLPITVKCDGERIHGKFSYFMALNGEYAGGFRLNKGDTINDSKVKVVMIKHGFFNLFNFFKLFMFGIGSIKKSKNVIIRDAKTIEIENHANASFTVDGEKSKFLKKKFCVKSFIQLIKK